jgi:NAD(P)-dependent dehydrogenase (short-subunit alcohol dehydrogenase family)
VVYLSSVSASLTPPWPGLSAYAVSKAALDKLAEAWRVEHPEVGFTRMVVGDCMGGEGDGQSQFSQGWDPELAGEMATIWINRGLLAGAFIAVEDLVDTVDGVLRTGASVSMSTIVVAPRPVAG